MVNKNHDNAQKPLSSGSTSRSSDMIMQKAMQIMRHQPFGSSSPKTGGKIRHVSDLMKKGR